MVALAASLVVHAVVLWRVQADPTPTSRAHTPLELTEIEWVENASPAPVPTSEGTAQPMKLKKKRVAPPAPARVEAPPSMSDSPTRTDLSVSDDGPFVVARPRGTTLHPGDLPSTEELRAETEARVQDRVEGWLKADLARARATKGLPDPAYGVLGAALREATDEVPALIDTNDPGAVGKAFATAWFSGAERYGKTGAPYDEPEGRQEFIERPSALEAAVQNGSVQARQLQQFLYAGARLQEFADGRTGLELYALVEVHQRDSGEVESVQLLRPSGLNGFDTWVLERANGVQLALTWDAGARKKPLRSVWRFDAIMKFRRKLKLKELDGRAVVGMIALSVLSGLSAMGDGAPRVPAAAGRFDEVTGEIDVVDLTNPTYDCTVKLVEAD